MTITLLTTNLRRVRAAFSVLFVAAFLTACATAFHSPEFEKDAFSASTELNSFLVANKSKANNVQYKDVVNDYNKIETLIDKVVLRARLVDNNETTTEIAEMIRGNFRDFRATHKEQGSATPKWLAGKQMAYEQLFYELILAEKQKPLLSQ